VVNCLALQAARSMYLPISQDFPAACICDANLFYTQSVYHTTIKHILTESSKETLQPHTQSPLRMRHLRTTVWCKSRFRAPRAYSACRVFPVSQAFLVHCPRLSNAE
jgi:hypothetical protein